MERMAGCISRTCCAIAALTARRSVLRSVAARSATESKYCTCGKTYGSLSGSQCASDARSWRAFGVGVKGWRSGDERADYVEGSQEERDLARALELSAREC